MILDRYIAVAILMGTLMSLFVFGAIFVFISFVSELQAVGINNYGALQAIIFVLLTLPQMLYQLFPSAILLGGLLSLGALASSSELVVMRAAGVSVMRIMRSALQAGVVLVVLVALMGEYLAPISVSAAKTLRAEAIEGRVLSGDRQGLWSKYGENFVFVGQVLPNVQLANVIVYELDDQRRLAKVTHADQAHYENDAWHLQDVSNTEFKQESAKATSSELEIWPAMISTDLFNVLNLEPIDLSAVELVQYSRYLDENDLDSDEFWLAFWVKVFTPLTAIGMLLIAIPLVLTSQNRGGSSGQRIVLGVVIGVSFYIANRIINHMGVLYGIPPVLSAGIPSVLVISIALVLIRRVR